MDDNIFENMTDFERELALVYMIFNRDLIMEKAEQWTKEAEAKGMTLKEYLESISPLNENEDEDERFKIMKSWDRIYGNHWILHDYNEENYYKGDYHEQTLRDCKAKAEVL